MSTIGYTIPGKDYDKMIQAHEEALKTVSEEKDKLKQYSDGNNKVTLTENKGIVVASYNDINGNNINIPGSTIEDKKKSNLISKNDGVIENNISTINNLKDKLGVQNAELQCCNNKVADYENGLKELKGKENVTASEESISKNLEVEKKTQANLKSIIENIEAQKEELEKKNQDLQVQNKKTTEELRQYSELAQDTLKTQAEKKITDIIAARAKALEECSKKLGDLKSDCEKYDINKCYIEKFSAVKTEKKNATAYIQTVDQNRDMRKVVGSALLLAIIIAPVAAITACMYIFSAKAAHSALRFSGVKSLFKIAAKGLLNEDSREEAAKKMYEKDHGERISAVQDLEKQRKNALKNVEVSAI